MMMTRMVMAMVREAVMKMQLGEQGEDNFGLHEGAVQEPAPNTFYLFAR